MKKTYEKAYIEVVKLDTNDIIVTSCSGYSPYDPCPNDDCLTDGGNVNSGGNGSSGEGK